MSPMYLWVVVVLGVLGVLSAASAAEAGSVPLWTDEERAMRCGAWLDGLAAHPSHEMYKSVVSTVSRRPDKPMTHQVRWDRRQPGKIHICRKHAGKQSPYLQGEKSFPLPEDTAMTVSFHVGYLAQDAPALLVCMAVPGERGARVKSVLFPFGRKTLGPAVR